MSEGYFRFNRSIRLDKYIKYVLGKYVKVGR